MRAIAKQRIHLLLDPGKGGTIWDHVINGFIVSLIIVNVFAVIIETVDSIYQPYQAFFSGLEIFSICVFTVEYMLRLWTCTLEEPYKHPVRGRLKYLVSFSSLIDLMAILPFYLPR